MSRIDEKYTPSTKAAEVITAKTPLAVPDALAGLMAAMAVPVTSSTPAKPAPKKLYWGPLSRAHAGGSAGGGVDRDGQVLNPSAEQRSMASALGARFPRGPGV
jgi:hypothetical protein